MAKYDSMRKTSRDALLISFYNANPQLSLEEIGEYFGIGRARVSQILKKHGILVNKYHTPMEHELETLHNI